MKTSLRYYKLFDYLFCIISGISLAFAFTYKSLWWICFFGLIPFLFVIFRREYTLRKFLRLILLFSVSYYIPLIKWIMNAGAFIPVSPQKAKVLLFFSLIFIGLLQGLYLCLALAFWCKTRKKTFADVFSFALLFVLGEWFIENTPAVAFPWGSIGVIATEFKPFIQSASIFGGLFITLLVIIINGGIAFIIINIKNKRKVAFAFLTIALIFLSDITFGIVRINDDRKVGEFKAMVVQGNYSGLKKWNDSTDEIFQSYVKLTREGVDGETKLVIWPETAVPTRFCKDSSYETELKKLAKELDVTLVVGFFAEDDSKQCHNSLIGISPDGTVSKPYFKQILAPFGEYVPFANFLKKILPSFTDCINGSSGISAQKKTQIIDTPIAKVGGVICYESIFSEISRRNVEKGAQVLAVASNDSWFDDSPALRQHFSHSVMRAVETKRFLLRASNTGISSIISPYGEIVNSAQTSIKTSCKDYIYLNDDKTFYCKMGQIFLIPCFAVYIYGAVKSISYRHRIKRQK